MPRLGKNIDFTGAGAMTGAFNNTGNTIYGSLTLVSAMTFTQTQAFTFEGRSPFTLTMAGKSFGTSGTPTITVAMIGGTLTFQDAFSNTTSGITLSNGTLDANDFSVALATQLFMSGTPTVNMGNGTWTMSGTGTKFTGAGTVNAEGSTIFISDTSASSKTFAGGGKTFNNLSISGGGAGAVIITGSNSFNRFPQVVGGTKTIQITAGTTQTFRTAAVDSFGNGSNVITIQSTSGGSTYTFTRANGIVSADYISLQDSIATGGAEWYAGANSTNVSGNTGWYFTVPQYTSSENLTKLGTSWVWGLDPTSYNYAALLQQEWVPSSANANIGNNGSLTAAHLSSNYRNLTFFKDYGSGSSSVDADWSSGSGTGTWTVTRSATTPATTIDSTGRIQLVQHTGPRFTSGFYDSTGFVSRPGLIVEGASTNMLKDSYFADGTTTYWRVRGTSTVVTSTERTTPFGFATQVIKATPTADASGFQTAAAHKPTVVSGTVYTLSAWVRGSTSATTVQLKWDADTGTDAQKTFTIQDSVWTKISLTFTASASEAGNIGIEQGGAGASTIYCAGIQLEALPFASTFIPTTTAALTRNAETLTYPISGNRTAATESLFVKATTFWTLANDSRSYYLTATQTKERSIYKINTTNQWRAKPNATDSGAVSANPNFSTVAFISYVVSMTMKHSSPYISSFVDGGSQVDYTVGDWTDPSWGTNFYLGSYTDGASQIFGIISSLAIFSDAKSASDVAAITRVLQ
jgi:hypothetical protein